jgi:hypothetical protein
MPEVLWSFYLPLNTENGRKVIEGIKIQLRAIEGSSKKRPYKKEAFFSTQVNLSRMYGWVF